MHRAPAGLQYPVTFNVGNEVAFRLYPDNRPRNLEIAVLQKGLVLMAFGVELIEEGAGFGVPIAKYSDYTYFSSSAELIIHKRSKNEAIFTKTYTIDAVSRKQIRGAFVNDNFYSMFHTIFEKAYLHRQSLRPIFDWIMRLRKTFGVQTQFSRVLSKGKISVTYKCFPNLVKVHVDLSGLDKANCEEILVLNEQGATNFRRYSDTDQTILSDGQIGAWVKVSAKQATFTDVKNRLSFTLEKKEGAALYRGRELVKDRFSWAGMTYSLSPSKSAFSYSLSIDHNSLLKKIVILEGE